MQPSVLKDVYLCKLKAASQAPCQEAWYLWSYVTTSFEECYSTPNTFAVFLSHNCVHQSM